MKILNRIIAVLLAVMMVTCLATVASAVTVEYGATSAAETFTIPDVYGFSGKCYVLSDDGIIQNINFTPSFDSPTGEGGVGSNGSISFNNNAAPENQKTGTVTVDIAATLNANVSGSCTIVLEGYIGTSAGGDVEWYSDTRTITVPAPHKHDYKETVVAPTCDDQGYTLYECSCGDSYKDNYVDALGHSYGDWVVTKEATCKEEGSKSKTCPACGDVKTEAIAKTEHSYGDWVVTKEATCKEEGSKSKTCSVCGDVKTEAIAKTQHKWGEWEVTTEATCGKKGEKTKTCSICGETETKSIAALEHKWGKWEVTEEATCTEDGEKTRECEHCGKKETKVIKATGHEYEYEKINSKQHKATCKICGHSFKEDHEFQYNGYCVCGYKKPVASTAGLDDVPKTGDITGQLVFGASAAVIALMAAAAFVFKRKTAK